MAVPVFAADEPAATAEYLIGKSGLSGGFVVHAGCGNGRLTAALSQNGRFIVQGLETDVGLLNEARAWIKSQHLYGVVSAEAVSPKSLPYADNLADMVVVDDLPRLAAAGLDLRELLRITCPGGSLCIGIGTGPAKLPPGQDLKLLLAAAGIKDFTLSNELGGCAWARKPRPATMGEWGHAIGGDSGRSSVSPDEVGVTRALQWIDGPRSPLGRWRNDGSLMACAGGRSFYVTVSDPELLSMPKPERLVNTHLVCRNAFNGVRLWSQPILDKPDPNPKTKQDMLLVASEDIVCVLDPMGGLRVFDSRTGKNLPAFSAEGNIYNASRPVPSMCVTVGHLVVADARNLGVYDTSTGKLKWSKKFESAKTDPLKFEGLKKQAVMVAMDGKVFDQRENEITCYDLSDGKVLWKLDGAKLAGKELVSFKLDFGKNGMLIAESLAKTPEVKIWIKSIHGISQDNGKALWNYESKQITKNNGEDSGWNTMYAAGLVWVQTQSGDLGKYKSNDWDWIGLNPRTGLVEKTAKMPSYVLWSCAQESSTEHYFICGRPPNLFDWKTGQTTEVRVCRPACRGGTFIANNLLYGATSGCGCIKDVLRGFCAFSGHVPLPAAPLASRLERGPEFGKPTVLADTGGWTTFRADAARSCSTKTKSSPDLKLLWGAQVADQKIPGDMIMGDWDLGPQSGDVLTQPTTGGDMAFVSQIQGHTLSAIEAATGKKRWDFVAGGRLDTPPTVYRGMCLLGSHDGRVYCLRASDGKLIWSFRGAPEERRVMAYGQIESPWPVVGGVLVDHDLAYFVAGRVTSADGGLYLYAVKPETGEVVWEKHHTSENHEVVTGKKNIDVPFEGAADMLMSDGKLVTMTGWWNFDPKTGEIKKENYELLRSSQAASVSLPGELINSDWRWDISGGDRQNYWANPPYFYGKFDNKDPGQPGLLVFDQNNLFGYFGFDKLRKTLSENARRYQPVIFAVKRADVDKLYAEWDPLIAKNSTNEVSPKDTLPAAPKSALWYEDIKGDLQVESLALSSGCLYAAGVKNFTKRSDGAFLRVYSAADGKMLKEIVLEALPSAEGLSISDGKLYVSLQNGKLLCFGGN